ncbi:MAG: hypothetical protein ACKVJN_16975, partial [Woeseiales bacterium]
SSVMAADGANPPISRQSASQEGTTVGPIYTPPDHQDISGVWWTEAYEPVLQLVGDGEIPYNEAGVARYEEIKAGIASSEITDSNKSLSVPNYSNAGANYVHLRIEPRYSSGQIGRATG